MPVTFRPFKRAALCHRRRALRRIHLGPRRRHHQGRQPDHRLRPHLSALRLPGRGQARRLRRRFLAPAGRQAVIAARVRRHALSRPDPGHARAPLRYRGLGAVRDAGARQADRLRALPEDRFLAAGAGQQRLRPRGPRRCAASVWPRSRARPGRQAAEGLARDLPAQGPGRDQGAGIPDGAGGADGAALAGGRRDDGRRRRGAQHAVADAERGEGQLDFAAVSGGDRPGPQQGRAGTAGAAQKALGEARASGEYAALLSRYGLEAPTDADVQAALAGPRQ